MMIRQKLLGPRPQLTCRQVGLLLQTHLDGELNPARTQRVAAHLEDCLRCGLEADTYRALCAALDRRIPIDPEPLARLHEFGARLAAEGPGHDLDQEDRR